MGDTVTDGKYVAVCIHCSRAIRSSDMKWWVHADGDYWGKIRCSPGDTGKPYGLEATPKEEQ